MTSGESLLGWLLDFSMSSMRFLLLLGVIQSGPIMSQRIRNQSRRKKRSNKSLRKRSSSKRKLFQKISQMLLRRTQSQHQKRIQLQLQRRNSQHPRKRPPVE